MSQQIIEAEYSNQTFYFKVPKGKKIEDAYNYYVKWLQLHIQWEEGGEEEEIEYFNETEPEYKHPTKVNIFTKDKLLDEGMDWLFLSDCSDTEDEELLALHKERYGIKDETSSEDETECNS